MSIFNKRLFLASLLLIVFALNASVALATATVTSATGGLAISGR